jgi:hypothetical protein
MRLTLTPTREQTPLRPQTPRSNRAAAFLTIALFLLICLTPTPSTVWAEERFTNNNDGTVTDNTTGLMWAATDNMGDVDWKQAQLWARFTFPYTVGTLYDDWRLPTAKEVQGLYVRDEAYPGYLTLCRTSVRIVPEIRLSCAWVWTLEQENISARLFNFNRGYQYMERMSHKRGYRALPVRRIK